MKHFARGNSSTRREHDSHPLTLTLSAAAMLSLAAGLLCFAVTELMHYLLVPDIGRRDERWLAQAIVALTITALMARVLFLVRRQQQATLARMQAIGEINHHIRNALMSILASAELGCDGKPLQVISEGVDRIDWALRNVLPREKPLSEEERSELMFHKAPSHGFAAGWTRTNWTETEETHKHN